MTPDEHREAIAAGAAAVTGLPGDRLDAPVPACPGWSVHRLVGHLGRVHRWAAAFLAADPDSTGPVDAGPRPPAGPAVLAWYREAAATLLAELARHHPGDPVRTFAGRADVAFWLRRQAHETAVHRWDAEDAVAPGRAPAVPPALAADGIDEWLTFFVPRFLERGDGTPPELAGRSLHLRATDPVLPGGATDWVLRLDPEGGVEVTRGPGPADAGLHGPASALLLAVWHRVPLDAVDRSGDAPLAARLLDAVHVT